METTTNTPNALARFINANGPQTHADLLAAGFWDDTIHRAAEKGYVREDPTFPGYASV